VPELAVAAAAAPAALEGLPPPEAIFLGGGVGDEGLWQTAWQALKPGGRLVANAVTLDGEAALLRRHALLGGALSRIAVATSEPLGGHGALRPHRAVTQLCVAKPTP
jgi:precorrin-6Y C5,15-methyltransferase (decarboxylating)